jgi:ABC-2 type transport system permease protein
MAMATISIAALVFFGFNLSGVGWGLVPITFILLLVGWSTAMLVIGLLLRFGQSAEILAWATGFVLLALSGVFNPVNAIPGPLQPVARVLPTTFAFSSARQLLDGDAMPWDDIAAGVVGGVVAVALSMFYVVHMLGVFRRRGYVTRFS